MCALIWKKYINIKTNKKKNIVFIVAPIIYFVFLYVYGIRYDVLVSFSSLSFALFSTMIHWNVEDLVYSEALLVTRLDTKRSWRLNYIFTALLGNIYSYIIILVGTCILNILGKIHYQFGLTEIMQNLCNIPLSMAIIGMGTLQYSDFSKAKQLFTSIFSMMNIAVPVALVIAGNFVFLTNRIVIMELTISIVLIFIGELITKFASNEKLIFNIQRMVDGYINNIIND